MAALMLGRSLPMGLVPSGSTWVSQDVSRLSTSSRKYARCRLRIARSSSNVTQCVVSDEFVDLVARPALRIRQPLDHRPLCQCGEHAEVCVGHRLGRLPGETADEDRQRAQHRTLPRAQPAPGTVQDHRKATMTLLDERCV